MRHWVLGLTALSLFHLGDLPSTVLAADDTSAQSTATAPAEATSTGETCCKAGDTTPPTELVKEVSQGQLHSPYQDFANIADEGHKQFTLPGCNECHGGTGGGGICPPLTQGVWFWGGDDDTLFRLITLGTKGLENEGYKRLAEGTVKAPMPAFGQLIKTSDDLWKIIAWIRSINPPSATPTLTSQLSSPARQ